MKPIALLTALAGTFSLSTSASGWMLYDESNSPLPSNSITATLNDGAVSWVGTDNGLAQFDGTDWTIYQSESSQLPDDHIHDIHKDQQDNIWVATDKGVLKISSNGWEVFDMSNSPIPSDQIRSIASDAINNVWIGTWGGGLARFDGSEWQILNTENSNIPSNGVFDVAVDDDQNIWVGTFSGGAARFNNQGWTVYDASNSSLQNNNVRCVTFDHSGIVWFGTDEGLARKTTAGHWDILTFVELGHSIHTIYDGIRLSDEHVYFATDGGLLEFDGATFTVYTFQNSNLPSNNLRCLSKDQNGNVWIGTGNNGLAIFSPEGTLSVDDREATEYFNPYPNPTSSMTTLALDPSLGDNFEVVIHNHLGQMLYRKKSVGFIGGIYPLNLDDLPPGILSITIISDRGSDTKQVLKL